MIGEKKLETIGSTEYVEVAGIKNIPAKIDTGADSSAIWASSIGMKKDGTLIFVLFDKKSSLYTGEILKTKDYAVKSVRSSNGSKQIRYRVKLPLRINGKNIKATFTLANRERNRYPILIGKRTLKGKFIVDVSRSNKMNYKKNRSIKLTNELKQNPYTFHQKYIKKGEA